MKLRGWNGEITQLNFHTTEEPGGKTVMILTAKLNKGLAEELSEFTKKDITELCYSEKGHPREFEGSIGLPVALYGAKVELGDRLFDADTIHKMKVSRKNKATDTDNTLYLTFRAHFVGDQQDNLWAFARETNKGEFVFEQEPIEDHLKGPALASQREMRPRGKKTNGAEVSA